MPIIFYYYLLYIIISSKPVMNPKDNKFKQLFGFVCAQQPSSTARKVMYTHITSILPANLYTMPTLNNVTYCSIKRNTQ